MGSHKGNERVNYWVSHTEKEKGEPWEIKTGIDKAIGREKRRGSHEVRQPGTIWGKGEVPWEKQMETGKERGRGIVKD